MNLDEKLIKIKVENVFKVFGKQIKKVIQMLFSGKNKKEILKVIGLIVGVN